MWISKLKWTVPDLPLAYPTDAWHTQEDRLQLCLYKGDSPKYELSPTRACKTEAPPFLGFLPSRGPLLYGFMHYSWGPFLISWSTGLPQDSHLSLLHLPWEKWISWQYQVNWNMGYFFLDEISIASLLLHFIFLVQSFNTHTYGQNNRNIWMKWADHLSKYPLSRGIPLGCGENCLARSPCIQESCPCHSGWLSGWLSLGVEGWPRLTEIFMGAAGILVISIPVPCFTSEHPALPSHLPSTANRNAGVPSSRYPRSDSGLLFG